MEATASASARSSAAQGVSTAATCGPPPSFLSAVAAGRFSGLSAAAVAVNPSASDEDVDMEAEEREADVTAATGAGPTADRFLPLLARLQHAHRSFLAGRPRRHRQGATADAAAASVDALLLAHDEANTLRQYAGVFERLALADIERFSEQLGLEAPQQAPLPLYRRFESGTPETRACLVLDAVRAFATAPPAALEVIKADNRVNELFLNEIYREELAAILVLALASAALQRPSRTQQSPFRRAAVVAFCLTLPVGAELIAILVENDPASSEQVLETIMRELAQLTEGKSMAQQERAALSLVTELPAEVVAIQDACITLARLSPFHAAMVRDRLRAVDSLWAVVVALHLHTAAAPASTPVELSSSSLSSLKDDATVFLLDWLRSPASPLLAFFRIAASRRSGEDKAAASPPPFQQVAEHLLELVKDQLLDDLETASAPAESTGKSLSPLAVTVTLGVWVSLLSLGNFRLTDHEAMRLVRSLDKVTKVNAPHVSTRIVSLAFVVVLLVCYPLAPVLSKIPSQRDEATKAVASLAQHCVFNLYSASPTARPLFIVSAVLLYTKSPALLPLLASVVGGTNAFHHAAQPSSSSNSASIRIEYLHVVGDVVLKQVLTENLMARDILMDKPPLQVSAKDRDELRDMPLRAIHGLLCEKSFLRFHHGRRLEAWLAQMIGGAELLPHGQRSDHKTGVALPVHPLLLSVLLEWIDNYVMAFEYPVAQTPTLQLSIVPLRPALVYRWLSAPCLQDPFAPSTPASEKHTTWARALLTLTYALHFNQCLRHAMEVPGSKLSAVSASMSGGEAAPGAFVLTGSDIVLRYELEQFPLRNMLLQAMASGGAGDAFEFIAPTLHRLMMEEFPGSASLPEFGDGQAEHDAESAWFQTRDSVLSRAMESDSDREMSWTVATLRTAELRDAPTHVVRREFLWLASALLPRAVSLQQQQFLARSTNEDEECTSAGEHSNAQTEALGFCRVATELFTKRLRYRSAESSSSDPDVIVRLVHALCYPDWTAKQFAQRQQLLRHGRATATADVPLVTTYQQLLEAPFRIVQDAERAVFHCPPLLELLLLLVRDVRHASNAQLARCDPLVGLARVSASQQQPQGVPQLPDAMTSRSTSVQQHQLIQDCLLTHALLRELAAVTPKPGASFEADELASIEPEATEASLLLCAIVDELFAEDATRVADVSSSSQQPLPPRLLTAVHAQGYDRRVVQLLVDRSPSLRLLWSFWVKSASPSSRSSSSSSGNGSSSSSNATSKPLMDFLVGDGGSLDKNAPRAGFRLCVFFTLCSKYLSAGDCAVVMPATKAVWNKLRSALSASMNAAAVPSPATTKKAAGEQLARVDGVFLLAVLPLAARACARHPELSAELVQFLLKLQKLLPASSGGMDMVIGGERRLGAASSTLERALHDAYRTLLQQMGA